jgi:hypothetical protein
MMVVAAVSFGHYCFEANVEKKHEDRSTENEATNVSLHAMVMWSMFPWLRSSNSFPWIMYESTTTKRKECGAVVPRRPEKRSRRKAR